MVTEWEIHEALEKRWNRTPLTVDGTKLHLLASEVMPDVWGINDPLKYWASPSIDFVFLSQDGTLWLVELKNRRDTLNDAWNAYCQVVYAEYLFTKNGVSAETLSLVRSRYIRNRAETPTGCLPAFNGNIRCMLLASSLRYWQKVVSLAEKHTFGEIKEILHTAYDLKSKRNLPMSRFCLMPLPPDTRLTPPIFIGVEALGALKE